MNTFKEQCIKLRNQDYTLTEISKLTGRSKTSIYFHIRNLPLSSEKRDLIREVARAQVVKIADRRRGKSARPFRTFSTWNTHTVFVVSHFIFDGEISYGVCAYNNRNKSLIKRVESSMCQIYDFEPTRYLNQDTGVSKISYFNVALAAYIKKKSVELMRDISGFRPELKRVFLQSFFDDEGCMDFRPDFNKRQVRGYQKDGDILRTVQRLLTEFDISSSIKLPNEVVIVGKENLKKFQKEIDFSPGVRINGKRSNSIWLKSIEKRRLLGLALSSYR